MKYSEFKINNPEKFDSLLKSGKLHLLNLSGKLPNGYWTKELLLSETDKYHTLREFRKKNSKAYSAYVKLSTKSPNFYSKVKNGMDILGNRYNRKVYSFFS